MVMPAKAERALITQEEFELLAPTHYPTLPELADDAISAAQRRIRDLRAKERTLLHQMRRSIRGKAESRGASFPGNVEKPSRRKQVFAGALKRLNREAARRHALRAREALKDSAHRALTLKSAEAASPLPFSSGRPSNTGMRPVKSDKRRTTVNPGKIGSVSQATKVAQAAKDARES